MEITAGTDPFTLFQSWYDDAVKTEVNDPDAMAIASVDKDGMPSVRMVLLRRWSPAGFLFFTNYESRKSGELLAARKAAFCIHWKTQRRQVRVVGAISKATAEQSDEYFNGRGRGSQIGAWASAQSRPLASRAALEAEVVRVEGQFPNAVARPPHWGGFCLKPHEIEFWHDGEHRLHDRFHFLKQEDGSWDIQRLNP